MATKTTTKETKTQKALSKTASLFGQLFLDRITEVDAAGNRSITTDKTKLGSWSKPWNVSGSRIPHNVVTGTGYKGGNAGLFSMAAGDHEHACFSTYKGWQGMTETDADGNPTKVVSVRKGESGWPGVRWNIIYVCAEGCKGTYKSQRQVREACGHNPRTIWSAFNFTVFGYWQVDVTENGEDPRPIEPGRDFDFHKDFAPAPKADLPGAEDIKEHFLKTGAKFTETGTGAYFRPSDDVVNVPPIDTFKTVEGYASTLAHEIVHWTGTPDRLGECTGEGCKKCEKGYYHRKISMTTLGYAAEELVAELGACILVSDFGIDHEPLQSEGADDNHGAYVLGWMQPLLDACENRDGERIIWDAMGAADKAAQHIKSLTGGFAPGEWMAMTRGGLAVA